MNNLLNRIPDGAQTCLISATLSQNVFSLSKKIMHDPLKILLKKSEIPVDLIKQYYIDAEYEGITGTFETDNPFIYSIAIGKEFNDWRLEFNYLATTFFSCIICLSET